MKSILIILCTLQIITIELSIALILKLVELHFQMGVRLDLPLKFCLCPAKLADSTQVPSPFLYFQLCFQNNHILRPGNLHGQRQQLGISCIHPIKLPHPAQVTPM